MALDDARVRVRLDTDQAKAELADLQGRAEKTSGNVSGGIRRALRRGLGAVGVGAAFQAGVSTVKGATSSGFGDLVGELLSPLAAQLNETILGDLDDEARATKAAREQLISSFGQVIGHTNNIPAGAQQLFDQTKQIMMEKERGRSLVEQDERFGLNTDPKDVIARIIEGFGNAVKAGLQWFWQKLTGSGG